MSTKDKSGVVVPLRRKNQATTEVKSIITTKELPPELKLLIFLQKSTSLTWLTLMAAVLTIFGLSVSIPQLWNQEYQKLKNLQRQERQLTVTNEKLRNQLIQQQQSQKDNIIYPQPDNALFLSLPPTEREQPSKSNQDTFVDEPLLIDSPLGY